MHTEIRELNDAEREQVSGGMGWLGGIGAGTEVWFVVRDKVLAPKPGGPSSGDKGPAGPVPA